CEMTSTATRSGGGPSPTTWYAILTLPLLAQRVSGCSGAVSRSSAGSYAQWPALLHRASTTPSCEQDTLLPGADHFCRGAYGCRSTTSPALSSSRRQRHEGGM